MIWKRATTHGTSFLLHHSRSFHRQWTRQTILTAASLYSTMADNAAGTSVKTTPMVEQYLARKKEYPDCMLLFQVGDFYEFFGDDARRASHLLNLALTKKSKKANELEEMCGFPIASLDSYVEKLVMHHGAKVAICNQVESAINAKKRGYKTLVDRQVVRIVTPGSLVDETMLTPQENNYLAALFYDNDKWGLAWTDLSTGEFVSTTATNEKLVSALLRCSPKEILLPTSKNRSEDMFNFFPEEAWSLLESSIPQTCMKTYRPVESFDARNSVARHSRNSEILMLDPAERAAASAILDYVTFTQKSSTALIGAPLHMESSDHMIIDSSAWRALELSKSLSGLKSSSLLAAIDAAITPGGSRLLASHLASPLTNLQLLEDRLDGVTYFFNQEQLLKQMRKQLAEVFDMERSLQRLSIGVATPKDLLNVASTITEAAKLINLLESHQLESRRRLKSAGHRRELIQMTADEIRSALKDDFKSLNSKNGFVRPGYSKELDKWQSILHLDPKSSQKQELQLKYRKMLGSTRLRVVYQAEKGYFIDIPHDEVSKIMKTDSGRAGLEEMNLFQSLKNSVRYRTDELRSLNRDMMEASQEIIRLESEIFEILRAKVLEILSELQVMAHTVSQVDVLCSHAQIALDHNFSRPLLNSSRELHIVDGRHAVVEAAHLKGMNSAGVRSFVPNSLHFSLPPTGSSCWLLTGPNMGGKSTFLRQNAHLVVLAQMGSYVPAKFARIGIVDKLFCRVGSADDLVSDKSTFMVEMQETSTILKQATAQSLVLMDEVGRGTSVGDGIAIAGAVLEALCKKQVRTLFATHFTVLSDLVVDTCKENIQLYRMEVLEQHIHGQDHLVFSHRVVKGLADQSYGLNTAALAGCPPKIIARAAELLQQISKKRLNHPGINEIAQVEQLTSLLYEPGKYKLPGNLTIEQARQILNETREVLQKLQIE